MRTAYLEITAACNFRCSFCPAVNARRPVLTMPKEMVQDLIEQIRRDRLADRIFFHVMGEPTLHKDVVFLCRLATQAGLHISLVTNGSLLSKELSAALLDTRLHAISVSLRSSSDEYFSDIVKAPKHLDYLGYLEQIRSLIASSYERGPDYPTSINIRVFRRSLLDALRERVPHQGSLYGSEGLIGKLQRWGEELCGMTSHELRRRFPGRFASRRLIPLTPTAAIRPIHIMRWWQREADSVGTRYPAIVSSCVGFESEFAVLADGRVTACCLDYRGGTTQGNVRELSLKEILDGPGTREFVQSFARLHPPTLTCADCLGGNTPAEWIARQALAIGRRATRIRLG